MLNLRIKGDIWLNHFTSTSSGKTARIHISLDTEDEATLREILDDLAQAKIAQSNPRLSRTARFLAYLLKSLTHRKF